MKKIIIAVCLTLFLCNNAYADTYTDMVLKEHWAYNALLYAVDEGIINGFDDGTIKPDEALTRAQLAAMVVRIYGNNEKSDLSEFTDLSRDSWYYDYFSEAVAMNVFYGDGSGYMYPEKEITRQETFAVMQRVLKLEEVTGSTDFSDDIDIAAWARGAVKALKQNNYISGDENNCINPQQCITRAEFAQIIYNINMKQPEENTSDTNSGSDTKKNGGLSIKGSAGKETDKSEENEQKTVGYSDKDSYSDDIFVN